jgi:hypothetical protein
LSIGSVFWLRCIPNWRLKAIVSYNFRHFKRIYTKCTLFSVPNLVILSLQQFFLQGKPNTIKKFKTNLNIEEFWSFTKKIKLETENGGPCDFPLSVYSLLIVQTEVCRLSVYWRRNKQSLSVCKCTDQTCPSMWIGLLLMEGRKG